MDSNELILFASFSRTVNIDQPGGTDAQMRGSDARVHDGQKQNCRNGNLL